MKQICIAICICLVFFSCSSKKRIVTKKKKHIPKTEKIVVVETNNEDETTNEKIDIENTETLVINSTEDYIKLFSPIAKEEMIKYNIPASITLAQGILESASGKGRLAVEANNHFGIKCHDWTGDKIYHDDDASQECFRKYTQPKLSFEDHSIFLTTRKRYSSLFELDKDDYKAWAKGLRAAGYATDRRYPEKLIGLIERYELYKFDNEVLGASTKPKVVQLEIINHEVVKGDTLYSLSKKYNTTVEELKNLNQLTSNDLKIGQILVIKSN